MNRTRIIGLTIAVVVFSIIGASLAVEPEAKKAAGGKLRHVVLLKFKDGTSAEQIKQIEDAFCELPKKIPEIADFEWGTNVSVENLSQGFSHCFIVTFRNVEGRAVYIPHPAHKEFGNLLRPYLDKIVVVDFEPEK